MHIDTSAKMGLEGTYDGLKTFSGSSGAPVCKRSPFSGGKDDWDAIHKVMEEGRLLEDPE